MAGFGSRLWRKVTSVARTREARPVVRVFTALHTAAYRLSKGRAQARRYPTLLLTVVGRSSGRPRTVPLVYVIDGQDFVVCAAYSGAESDPAWWLNVKAAGSGVVQIGDVATTVSAVEVADATRQPLWDALVAMYPPFAYYQERTDRVFPVIRLIPTERCGSA